MTLDEFASLLSESPSPDLDRVRSLTLLAIQLRIAGVSLTLEHLADRASLAAAIAASAWDDGREGELVEELSLDEEVYVEVARRLVEAIT